MSWGGYQVSMVGALAMGAGAVTFTKRVVVDYILVIRIKKQSG